MFQQIADSLSFKVEITKTLLLAHQIDPAKSNQTKMTKKLRRRFFKILTSNAAKQFDVADFINKCQFLNKRQLFYIGNKNMSDLLGLFRFFLA